MVVPHLPNAVGVDPNRCSKCVVGEPVLGIGESGAIGEQCYPWGELRHSELTRLHDRLRLLRCEMGDDGGPIVGATGATDLIEVRVQQLLQPLAAAANARVMKLELQGLQFR